MRQSTRDVEQVLPSRTDGSHPDQVRSGFSSLPPRPTGEDPHGLLVAGIDLGSTNVKLLVTERYGDAVLQLQAPTPWTTAGSRTEMPGKTLTGAVRALLHEADAVLEPQRRRVGAIAITGMGESGVLVGPDNVELTPAIAWFDGRGEAEIHAFPEAVRREFSGRTGLPLGSQVTVAKLAWFAAHGVDLAGAIWLNLPEFLAWSLGAEPVAELSLVSRTGLLNQDTSAPWPAMLDALGVGPAILPRLVEAGTPLGKARDLPPAFRAALLTVAGHDHLVAAEAAGHVGVDTYHVSLGTAEVLLRVIDKPLGRAARERLAGYLINEVHHIVPGKRVLVAGLKTGLLLSRAMHAIGVHDRAARAELDRAVVALGPLAEGDPGPVTASGARNDDGELRLTFTADGARPEHVFRAVLEHSNDEIRRLIHAMDAELPPATSAILTGGWIGMRSVVDARAEVLPHLTVSDRAQETAYGATRSAARLLDVTATP